MTQKHYADVATMRKSRSSAAHMQLVALSLIVFAWLIPASTFAQTFELRNDAAIQKRLDAVLALMGYTLAPDVTTGSLSISNGSSGNPDFGMSSLGGGFTMSKEFPLYLEGTAGFSRYDPTFIASNGVEEREIPLKWNAFSATVGVGWDFPIAHEIVLRPVFNFSFGHVESDIALAGRFVENEIDDTIKFLEHGRLDAYGFGGSMIVDYEHYRPNYEIDVELRYTDILLKSDGDTPSAVVGEAKSQTINLWSRWRAPTRFRLLDRPVRYVLEYAHTAFLGDLDGTLGFDSLNSVGAGLELDSSKYDIVITRTRLVARYKFGENVSGWSVGFAVSF